MTESTSSALTPREALRRVPFFRRLRAPQLDLVIEASVTFRVLPGDTVISQDETGQALYVMLSGLARGTTSGRTEARTFAPGDYVGELALLEPAPSLYTIRASEPSLFLSLTQVRLAEAMRKDPEIAIVIAREASRLARSIAPTDDSETRLMRAQMLLYAEDLKKIYDEERTRSAELRESLMDTIKILVNAIESRDPRQIGHGSRVARYCQILAQQLGWSEERSVQAAIGGLIHDVGLVSLDEEIARKRGPMERAEIAQFRQHPELGARLLRGIKSLEPLVPYVLHHHENFDGTGYPERLRGQDIPIEARLVAVVDEFDDRRSILPAGDPNATDEVLRELRQLTADRLDPTIVQAFLDAYRAGHIIV